ncbi:FtsX-like permease family protein [Marinilabiliaceae bacterium JC017]|nr:FtsX-like permease family protein [Marinilabiliaceae bacterium JC017]
MKSIKALFTRYLHDILIAVEAILAHKMKSLLTGMGIMFGVAAVISMLAIGKGAQQEVLDQIKLVGVNNIIISPAQKVSNSSVGDDGTGSPNRGDNQRFSRGLTLLDAQSIKEVIPGVTKVSPVVLMHYQAIQDGKSCPVGLEGVAPEYFDLLNIELEQGAVFTEEQGRKGVTVCVIGSMVKDQIFGQKNPLGRYIKCGQVWLQVIGVAQSRGATSGEKDQKGMVRVDDRVFVPVKTMLLRFKDRSRIKPEVMEGMARGGAGFFMQDEGQDKNESTGMQDQLDKIIVQVDESDKLSVVSDVIHRMLQRRHAGANDFEITVPELLLKQQQKTNDVFNIVLGAIASISLIVGGIGIMNIMLASVWERIREIGTRQAIGASRKDIIVQFLAESTLISITGGIIGIILGVVLAQLIQVMADIKTIVSLFSVVVAFGVSASVGILFGYLPAKQAATQDPVESLRH